MADTKTYTPNYNLVKPGQDDFYNVEDFNTNVDKLDAELHQHSIKAVLDHPDNSVTDNKIGNRTVDQSQAPTAISTGTLSQLFGWLANRVKAITGKTNWYDAPVKTLEQLHTEKLSLTGGTMTGALVLAADPTAGLHAATKQYTDNKVAAIVDSSPGTLDTLNELAAALGDDPNFATTITNLIATKVATTDPRLSDARPANGGNADTVDGKHSSDFAPNTNILNGARNVCYKICTVPKEANRLVHLQILDAQYYDAYSVLEVVLHGNGYCLAEYKGTNTSYALSVEMYDNNGAWDIYLRVPSYCDYWNVYVVKSRGIAGFTNVLVGDGSYVPPGTLRANTLNGYGCSGITLFNGKLMATTDQIPTQGTRVWVSADYTPVANTPTVVTHGLSIDPLKAKCDVLLRCVEANATYSVGDYAISLVTTSTIGVIPPIVAILSTTAIQTNTGSNANYLYALAKTNGTAVSLTLSKWRYVFRIFY